MSKADKAPYAAALETAQALETSLCPFSERILIAGSLRRRKAEIGDLELVVLPRVEPILDMFGEAMPGMERSALDEVLAGVGTFRKNGARYKQFTWEGYSVDLFIANRDTWGCVATIRTGCADFSHWLVTPRRQGGGCPAHLHFHEGRIWENGKAIETPEEADVFAALDLAWVEPAARTAGRWRR